MRLLQLKIKHQQVLIESLGKTVQAGIAVEIVNGSRYGGGRDTLTQRGKRLRLRRRQETDTGIERAFIRHGLGRAGVDIGVRPF